ncbi:MAG: aminodeoxychorismate/anthranilate synthase component II [Bacteroidota bacterium]
MKILVLDNYDSFTYNLVHIVRELGYGEQMDIFRNDAIDLGAVERYDKIILSPGPGIPEEAGILMDLIRRYGATKQILGVCLGHQAIGEVYGAELFNLPEVLHGIPMKTTVLATNDPLFSSLPADFYAARYHSWVIEKNSLPADFELIASDDFGEIMGIRHKTHSVYGLQFHPESILTDHGIQIIKNWLAL